MTQRPDPVSLAFGGPAIERFQEIKADAGSSAITRAAFAQIPSVQRLITTIEAPTPEILAEYMAALYVGFAYWMADGQIVPVDRTRVDSAIGSAPATPPMVPRGARYLQFPERWFWTQVHTGEPHEPLDGIFAVGPATKPHDRDEITLLAVSGLRPGRDGFSQVALSASPPEFAAAVAMLRRPLFAPTMDGGARMGFRSVTTPAELLHLAHVALVVTGG